MSEQPVRVLLVEDEPAHASLVKRYLSSSTGRRFELTWVQRLSDGLERLEDHDVDVVLLDLGLPDSGPDATLARTLAVTDVPVVVLTTTEDPRHALAAVKAGAQDHLPKPRITADLLVRALSYAIERKASERQLRHLNETLERRVAERTAELRALAQKLTQTEQRERRRLAQTIHDEIQQLLAVAKMQASFALDQPGDPDPIRRIQQIVDEAVAACRTLTINLSPTIVRDADLGAALTWLGRHMGEQYSLVVNVTDNAAGVELSEDLRTLLFEITRELLFNVVKHAGVLEAAVTLGREDGSVYVEVSDEGRGCDVEVLKRTKPESFGLFSIRERLNELGGRFEAEGAPGRGCRVRISVPYPQVDPDTSEVPASRAAAPTQPTKRLPHRKDRSSDQVMRVLLADDHAILRQGIAQLLAAQSDTRVVGEASDGVEALELARQLKPDVIVMDVNMPRLGGIEATRLIRHELPATRVIALSMHDYEDMAAAMLDAGAETFLNKCGPSNELLDALRNPTQTSRTSSRAP